MMVFRPNWPEGGGVRQGGFNVSNLMGIKRRMIDIGKKLLFTVFKMFENVQLFSHLHLNFSKSA
jgi:hypothetical protein